MDERPQFSVEIRRPCEGATVVAAIGEIDLHTAPRLREALESLEGGQISQIVIDLSGSSFIDSSGLGAIVTATKRLQPNNAPAVVCRDEVREVFLMTGLGRVFAIHDSVEEALGATSPSG